MKKLFADHSDSEDEAPVLRTNKEYEKVYNSFREKELKQKFKDRGEASHSDDSDTSSDDNDGEDPDFDEVFFKTLASLKSKDPKIYNKDVNFFNDLTIADRGEKKRKIFTVKDLERKVILENEGEFEDESDQERNRPASPSLAEKERALKRELQSVVNRASDDEDEDNWGGLFQKRRKTDNEAVHEEKQYAQWLSGQSKPLKEDDQVVLKDLKSYWSNPELPKEDKFLRDYILKGKYKEESSRTIPTRDEILGEVDPDQLSEDERDLEQQEEFEQKYNFRFEEPDQDFIKSYPRTIEWSVRAEDDRRKQKRTEVKDRKVKEKEQRRQELEMLKEIKRKEIQDKINKLKMVTGKEALPINDDFLDEDFDPEEHDRKMQEMFNEEYYKVDEGEEKPDIPDDIDDLKVDDYDNYDPAEDEDEAEVEGGGDGEASEAASKDRKREFQEEVLGSTSRGRRRKRQSKFVQMLKKEKPVFDPEDEKTYAEYIDEYYKLDYEDMIGDIKCRFKYVETVPNDFGLSTAEILLAKSKELNQWAGLKKTVQIRPPHIEQNEAKVYQKKGQNVNLKKKILKSLFNEEPDSDPEEGPSSKSCERKSSDKAAEEETGKSKVPPPESVSNTKPKRRNRNRKKEGKKNGPESASPLANKMQGGGAQKKKSFDLAKHRKSEKRSQIKELNKKDASHISENRLRALGINPKKYQNKLMYGSKEQA